MRNIELLKISVNLRIKTYRKEVTNMDPKNPNPQILVCLQQQRLRWCNVEHSTVNCKDAQSVHEIPENTSAVGLTPVNMI